MNKEKSTLEQFETLPDKDFPIHLYDNIDTKLLSIRHQKAAFKWLKNVEDDIKNKVDK